MKGKQNLYNSQVPCLGKWRTRLPHVFSWLLWRYNWGHKQGCKVSSMLPERRWANYSRKTSRIDNYTQLRHDKMGATMLRFHSNRGQKVASDFSEFPNSAAKIYQTDQSPKRITLPPTQLLSLPRVFNSGESLNISHKVNPVHIGYPARAKSQSNLSPARIKYSIPSVQVTPASLKAERTQGSKILPILWKIRSKIGSDIC